MNVKIDTKEKFTVITPEEVKLTAILTGELVKMLLAYQQKDIPHLVLNMQNVTEIDVASGEVLADCQQQFYEHDCSFVICTLQPAVEALLDQAELLEVMNVTPTESEAWDIVQMEEIERELMGDE
jgi:anti-anti-sigma factor